MSQAEELLNNLSNEDIALYTTDPEAEEHIVIDNNRNITVPEPLRRIAVQYDHNIETVTFDCPRYWDNNDLSMMYIYINYRRSDSVKGRYLVKNIKVDETDSNIIHFDWTIGNEITIVNGTLSFLVCAVKTDSEGNEEIHWNTELNNQMNISNGLECKEVILEKYPDIMNDIFTRLDTVIADNDEITANNSTIIADNAEIVANTENIIATSTELTRAADAAVASHNELSAKLTYIENNMEEVVGEVAEDSFAKVSADLSNEFYRVKNEVLETGEANGTTIHLEDSAMAEMQELEVDGVCEQETTTGKNLFDDSSVSVSSGGSINNSVITQTNVNCNISFPNISILSGETIYFSADIRLISGSSGTFNQINDGSNVANKLVYPTLSTIYQRYQTSFTYSSDTTINKLLLQITNLSGSAEIKNIMISTSSDADFEPYTGGQPSPNPDYPQEIEVLTGNLTMNVCGKNLLPNNAVTSTINGITFTVNRDKSITCNGTATAKATIGLLEEERILSKGNHVLSISNTSISGLTIGIKIDSSYYSTNTNKVIEISNDIATFYKWYIDIESGTTLNNVTIYPMLNQGSSVIPYEPYQGQSYEINLGKNLFDVSKLENATWSNTTSALRLILYLDKVEKGTAISVTNRDTSNFKFAVGFTKFGYPNSSNITINESGYTTSSTYTITANNDGYPFLQIAKSDDTSISPSEVEGLFQIEKGSTATPYAPYITPIEVCKINDTYKDTLNIKYNEEDGRYHLVVEKNIGKVVLDGSEEWGKAEHGYLIYSDSTTPKFVNRKLSTPGLCVNFIVQENNKFTWTGLYKCGWNESGSFWIRDDYTLASSLEEWKSWLASNNVDVYYVLAEPYTIDLGVVDMPLSYDGVTNISSSHELQPKINITYYRNFISTIRNLQVNEKTLKQELVNIESRLSALEAAQASAVSESEVEE